MENQDDNGVIDRFKKFAEESNSKFGDQISEWRKMRDFACGDQTDATYGGMKTSRYKALANIIPRIRGSVVNPVRITPYGIDFIKRGASTDDSIHKALTIWMHDLVERSSPSLFQSESLTNSVGFGIGAFYAYTDIDEMTGEDEVFVEHITDPTMLVLDPSSSELTGADSEKLAFVEIISKDRAKREYGEDACENWDKPIVGNFGGSWSVASTNQVQLVTYFERVDEGVAVHKLVGDKVVSSVTLPISRIPVFLVKGMCDWAGQKQVLHGLAQMLKDVQLVVNYSQSQLGERLKRAPKAQYAISKAGMEGNIDYYKDMDKNLTPLLPYNEYDKQGRKLSVPTRVDNSVQTGDLKEVFSMQQGLAAAISGVNSNLSVTQGLGDRETAEGLLLRTKTTEVDISLFREHLKSSIKALGKILLELFAYQYGGEYGFTAKTLKIGIAVQVTKGPELVTSKQEARQQLLALAQLTPESMKPVLAYGVASTLDNPEMQEVSKMLFKLLPPQVFTDNPQIQQLQQQMAQQIQQLQSELAKKDQTINALNHQIHALQLRSQADVTVAQINANAKLQSEALKQGVSVERQAAQSETEIKKMLIQAQAQERRDAQKAQTDAELKVLDKTLPQGVVYPPQNELYLG